MRIEGLIRDDMKANCSGLLGESDFTAMKKEAKAMVKSR